MGYLFLFKAIFWFFLIILLLVYKMMYRRLELISNRTHTITITGAILELSGYYLIAISANLEVAIVGYNMATAGRIMFGLGLFNYGIHKLKSRVLEIIMYVWLIANATVIIIGSFTKDHTLLMSDLRLVNLHGTNILVGTRGPLYFANIISSFLLIVVVGSFFLLKLKHSKKVNQAKLRMDSRFFVLSTLLILLMLGHHEFHFDSSQNGIPLVKAVLSVLYMFLSFKYHLFGYDEVLLYNMLEDTEQGFAISSQTGEVLYVNNAMKAIFPEIEEENAVEIIMEKYHFDPFITTKQFEKDGKHYKFNMDKIVVDGQVEGYKVSVFDVTSLINLQKETIKNAEEKSLLLTGISHELRTPLNAIIGATDVAEEIAPHKREIADYFSTVRTHALKMDSLLRKLMALSESSEDNLSLGKEITLPHFTAPEARILVVDDNRTNLHMATAILKQYGISADSSNSGFDCYNRICAGAEYDLIFMDYMMEGMDGIETTQRIRMMKGPIANIPIIVFTANSVPGAEKKYIDGGMTDCLYKPANKKDFGTILLKHLPDRLIKYGEDVLNEESSEKYPVFEGVDVSEAKRNSSNNLALYLDVLADFHDDIFVKTKAAKEYYEAGDYKNFTVLVHGLKSIARIIGIRELSEKMAALEDAGKREDEEFISDNLSETFLLCELYGDLFKPYSEERAMKQRKAVSGDETENILIKIREQLDDFEMEAAQQLLNTLHSQTLNEGQKELLVQLSETMRRSDYYASLDYVDKLLDTYSVTEK